MADNSTAAAVAASDRMSTGCVAPMPAHGRFSVQALRGQKLKDRLTGETANRRFKTTTSTVHAECKRPLPAATNRLYAGW
jgi:hypothetical protein